MNFQLNFVAVAVFCVSLAISSPSGAQYDRSKRSPQFSFTGRNVLSDLAQQIKPPSLSDFDDFRQKITNLANFTAILEQALAAEKAARNTLQNFVDSIREQITGIQTAVNPDPENFWMESKECGGILVSQTGKISYKENEFYKDHERCVWTVRTNHRSKIKVTLSDSGLEEFHDFIAIAELIENKDDMGVEWISRRMKSGETSIFNGPVIFISFVSDGSIRKTGFKLEFEGLGSNIRTQTVYEHFYVADTLGQFDSTNISQRLEDKGINIEGVRELVATVVVNPICWNCSRLELTVGENELDLRPEECDRTELSILQDFSSEEHGRSKRCCGTKCEENTFKSFDRTTLAILKSSDLSDGSQFQLNWSTDINSPEKVSENICGGLLNGDHGKISYKPNMPYENNERCVWLVSSEKLQQMEFKIQLLKEQFEHRYDYITLSYFTESVNGTEYDYENELSTTSLYKASDPVLIVAPFVIIQFYSDAANLGKVLGFELIWEVKYRSGYPSPFGFEFSLGESGRNELSCPVSHEELKDKKAHRFDLINAHSPNKDGFGVSHVTLEVDHQQDLSVFTSESGNFSKPERTSSGTYQSKDGIFFVKSACDLLFETHPIISWKTEVTENNASPGNVEKVTVKSIDTCGQVLHGDSGTISYKLGKEYDLNERCTWVIRTKSLSTISVRLMADGFESCCDGVVINRIDTARGLIEPNGFIINRENRFQTVQGPALLVTFFSDHSVKGTGFSIQFETKGTPSAEDFPISHSYALVKGLPSQEEPFAPVFIELFENSITLNTFQFADKNETSVALTMDNLRTADCHQDSVALYHMPEIIKYELLKQHPDNAMCALGAPLGDTSSSVVFQRENVKFRGPLLVVAKIKEISNDKSLSLTFQ